MIKCRLFLIENDNITSKMDNKKINNNRLN